MVQKPLRPGGDTGMRREGVIRGYGRYGLPRIALRQFCPAKLGQNSSGLFIARQIAQSIGRFPRRV